MRRVKKIKKEELRRTIRLRVGYSERFDSCAPAHLTLAPSPTRSLLPSQFYLLCRFPQKLHWTSRFSHLCRAPPGGSIRSLLPSQLCLPCRSSRSLHSQATTAATTPVR